MKLGKNNYQIIATLGPAVKNKIEVLVEAGATGFRLNCSHLSLPELSSWLLKLEKAFNKMKIVLPVWLDLQGAKLRVGRLTGNVVLKKGEVVHFKNNYRQRGQEIPLPHKWVFEHIQKNDAILLDDGKLQLRVTEVGKMNFFGRVVLSGELSSFKGFVVKQKEPPLNTISDRDRNFIEQTCEFEFVGYAISYLQTAEELLLFKKLTKDRAITAKIEREQAFSQLRQFGETADVSWLCRGDLGTSAQLFDLYQFEKDFAMQMGLLGKPFLIAGQVLENMVHHNTPSRSEIAHLGFLLENGFSGVVLSDETAIGSFPIEVVEFCRDYLGYLMD